MLPPRQLSPKPEQEAGQNRDVAAHMQADVDTQMRIMKEMPTLEACKAANIVLEDLLRNAKKRSREGSSAVLQTAIKAALIAAAVIRLTALIPSTYNEALEVLKQAEANANQTANQQATAGLPGPRSAFYRTPKSLMKSRRLYPESEPPANKHARLQLRDAVAAAATWVINFNDGQINLHTTYDAFCTTRSVQGFRKWRDRLNDMLEFKPVLTHVTAAHQNVYSGDRMTPELMNQPETEDIFKEDPRAVLKMLVLRAVHRHVNNHVFATFDAQSTQPTNPNALSVGRNVLTKGHMSRRFLHNSQRAFWSPEISVWAAHFAVPAAQNAVVVALAAL